MLEVCVPTRPSLMIYFFAADREDYCHAEGFANGIPVLNDFSSGQGSWYMCEFDIPNTTSYSATFGSDIFLRSQFMEFGMHALGSFGTA